MKKHQPPFPLESGFTLLELLVVIAILSAVALAAFDIAGEDRAQVRIDDTRSRLNILRRAILGLDSPAFGGEVRLSGFVADNGRLPENLRELPNPGSLYPLSGIVPEFSGDINEECLQNGSPISLGEGERLLKGHRGNYLAGMAQNNVFRDGWGNVGHSANEDLLNFGWKLEAGEKTLSIASLGADNAKDPPAPASVIEADADRGIRILSSDWQVALDGWKVRLKYKNSGGSSLPASELGASDFGKLGFALLVFENTSASGIQWRQYRSVSNSCNAATIELNDGEECAMTFSARAYCAASQEIPAWVPLGRHVLVLTSDNHGLPPAGRRIFKEVDFFPGAVLPNPVLEVR